MQAVTDGGRGLRSRLDSLRERSESGYVAVFVALCLPLFIGMCALAIDVANWHFRGQQIQKAADNASLAGVVYLPGSPTDADTAAKAIAKLNGFQDGVNGAVITTAPVPGKPSQLRVTISAPVTNAFGSIFGHDTSIVTRTVVADYAGPVPMGSPCNSFGNSPGTPWNANALSTCSTPDLWLQAAGPQATKVNGDRYLANRCDASPPSQPSGVYLCNPAGGPNEEFSKDGYFYVVRVKQAGPVTVQMFDPEFANTGQYCNQNLDTGWSTTVTGINEFIPGSSTAQRSGFARRLYAEYGDSITGGSVLTGDKASNTPGPYCPGDSYAVGSTQTPPVTSFVMRGPYDQSDPRNAPVITTCGPGTQGASRTGPGWAQFAGYDEDNGFGDIRRKLTQSLGAYDRTFAGAFRQWVTFCTFNAEVGDYLLQIRTNVGLGTNPTVSDNGGTAGGGGQNMMALRAIRGGSATSSLSMFGLGRMSIYANTASTSRQFYLARASSGTAGKLLRLQLYDIGDGNGLGGLKILPPTDSGLAEFTGCVGTVSARSGSAWSEQPDPAAKSNCTTTSSNTNTSTSTATSYNGKVLTFRVPIPRTYRCNDTDPAGCWIKIQYTFAQPPHDVTTWSASIEGDPVRIVE